MTKVFDKSLGKYKQITIDEFNSNKSNYLGPATGKINVINKITGIRSQIPKDQFNTEIYLPLGSIKYLFPCKNKLTNQIKNINIYEWGLVKEQYEIIDYEKFNRAKSLI